MEYFEEFAILGDHRKIMFHCFETVIIFALRHHFGTQKDWYVTAPYHGLLTQATACGGQGTCGTEEVWALWLATGGIEKVWAYEGDM